MDEAERNAMHHLTRSQEIKAPLDMVFRFFSRPENLQILTPPLMYMYLLTPSPIPMHVGSIIDYVVTIAGIPMRWTSCISEFEPKVRFVDVQLRGPYSFWYHTHSFEERGDMTIVHDSVVYALPLGLIGNLAHRLFVRRQLDQIFSYRQQYMERDAFVDELRDSHLSKHELGVSNRQIQETR